MARVRMTNADAAWLHMDRPTNHMVINAVMWFDEPVDWDRLRQVYEDRFIAPYPRFTQRIVEPRVPGGRLVWEDDPDFDLDRHLVRVELPAPGDRAALERYIGEQMCRPLDVGRPLWETHLVDGYDGGAAVYCRIHHAVADGIALTRLLLSMTDDDPDESLFRPVEVDRRTDGRGLAGRAQDLVAGTVQTTGQLARAGLDVVTHPSRAVQLAQVAYGGTRALGKELLLPPDRRTVLKGPMGQRKHARWSDPVPLADVKAIGRANGATVNDVLCAAVAGALHTYLARRDSVVEDIRALVPFNLRPLDEPLPRDLGNQFGLVFLPLPVGTADRQERLVEVKRRMDAIKSSPEGAVAYGVLSAIGMTPTRIEKVIVDVFGSKGSLVLTNVPGPTAPVYLAGTRLAGIMGWVPAGGGIGLGVSIFSYVGQVTVGVSADARLIPDPEVLVTAFNEEVAELLSGGPTGVPVSE
jgi:diacylglycerol O-acyltransferase / wax synthase